MHDNLKKVFLNRLNLIISFLEKPTIYKYADVLNDIKFDYTSLKDFPQDLSLLLQDKELRQHVNKYDENRNVIKVVVLKNELRSEVFSFIKEREKTWEHFTGDSCYPIPIKENVNENYIPLYGWYKNKSDFYIKANKLCISYFKHLREPLL